MVAEVVMLRTINPQLVDLCDMELVCGFDDVHRARTKLYARGIKEMGRASPEQNRDPAIIDVTQDTPKFVSHVHFVRSCVIYAFIHRVVYVHK